MAMAGRRSWLFTASLGVAVLVAGGMTWKALVPLEPDSPVVDSEDLEDGPVMDLDYLTAGDLAFLEQTLLEGSEAAQRSAAKALLVAERLEGAPMLFEAAARGGPDALIFCLAGLEILRLQLAEDALRELLLAIRRGGSLPEGCRVELADRFGLVSRGQLQAVIALAADPDPEVRSWVAETVSQQESGEAEGVLFSLVADPEPQVRRSAWLGLQGRSFDPQRPALVAAVGAENDPRNMEILQEMGLR